MPDRVKLTGRECGFYQMSEDDPAKPFRLYSTPSSGVSAGQRAAPIHCTAHATLAEAKEAIRNLKPGYSVSCIVYGPAEEVAWCS
jgi:hypothetical protein